MKHSRKALLLFVWMFLGFPLTANNQSNSPDHSLAHAEELWELAIAAKGGREALYKVNNIAVIRQANGSDVRLVALPDKYFSWVNLKPSVFGINIHLYNYESGFGYRTFTSDKRKVYQDIRTDPDFKTIKGRHVYLLYP